MSIVIPYSNVREDMNDRSENQLISLCCHCLEEAGLLDDGDNHSDRIARAIRAWRNGNGELITQGCTYVEFKFEGAEYTLADESYYNHAVFIGMESYIEDIQYEFDKFCESVWFSHFISLDTQQIERELMMDADSLIYSYDGVVHEIGVSAYEPDGLVYGTGDYYYLWRTN